MIVGSLSVRLLIREARSLKDKRQVVRSIIDRLKNQFNLSVSEVGQQDSRQMVELGFAMVCNEAHPIKLVFGQVVEALRCHPIAELIDFSQEV